MEARRIAAQFLKDHSKDGHFNVWLDQSEDIELIAQRLREFGCMVEVDHTKRTLEIDPPPASPVSN